MKTTLLRPLTLDLDDDHDDEDNNAIAMMKNHHGFTWGDTTFRAGGMSIGQDYLRLEGTTVMRGQLTPSNLELKEILGRGSFSVVRRAIWTSTASKDDDAFCTSVAVKSCRLLESTSQERDMLLKELRALCQLSHEGLVRLHGAFLSGGDAVSMVLEYMDQGSLDVYVRKTGPISSNIIASIAYQTLDGLVYLHNQRVLHRDLKPANVLLSGSGNVKLCDFGMATLQNGGLSQDSSLNTTVLGTRKFMAPERLRAQPYGRSSDVWSFGLILLECATGETPWNEVTSLVDLLITIEETHIPDLIPPTVEAGLEEIIRLSLQLDPTKRLPTKVLLQSPWFRSTHRIVDRASASCQIQQLAFVNDRG